MAISILLRNTAYMSLLPLKSFYNDLGPRTSEVFKINKMRNVVCIAEKAMHTSVNFASSHILQRKLFSRMSRRPCRIPLQAQKNRFVNLP